MNGLSGASKRNFGEFVGTGPGVASAQRSPAVCGLQTVGQDNFDRIAESLSYRDLCHLMLASRETRESIERSPAFARRGSETLGGKLSAVTGPLGAMELAARAGRCVGWLEAAVVPADIDAQSVVWPWLARYAPLRSLRTLADPMIVWTSGLRQIMAQRWHHLEDVELNIGQDVTGQPEDTLDFLSYLPRGIRRLSIEAGIDLIHDHEEVWQDFFVELGPMLRRFDRLRSLSLWLPESEEPFDTFTGLVDISFLPPSLTSISIGLQGDPQADIDPQSGFFAELGALSGLKEFSFDVETGWNFESSFLLDFVSSLPSCLEKLTVSADMFWALDAGLQGDLRAAAGGLRNLRILSVSDAYPTWTEDLEAHPGRTLVQDNLSALCNAGSQGIGRLDFTFSHTGHELRPAHLRRLMLPEGLREVRLRWIFTDDATLSSGSTKSLQMLLSRFPLSMEDLTIDLSPRQAVSWVGRLSASEVDEKLTTLKTACRRVLAARACTIRLRADGHGVVDQPVTTSSGPRAPSLLPPASQLLGAWPYDP